MADYSKMTTAELEAMLAKMKAEKVKTGSTLSVDQIRNAQKKINKFNPKIGISKTVAIDIVPELLPIKKLQFARKAKSR